MKKDYKSLSEAVEDNIENFFKAHGDLSPESGLYERVVNEVEKILIKKTLEHVNGIQSQAAKILGINRNTLYKKIKNLNILCDSDKFKC